MNKKDTSPVMKSPDGLSFKCGPNTWEIPPFEIYLGEWIVLVPDGEDPGIEPAGALTRVLVTIDLPLKGTLEIFGVDISRLDYHKRLKMRSLLGFVHGFGGLLSNRTIKENILLPLSVHAGLSASEEIEQLDSILTDFALHQVADYPPHLLTGELRWLACLARSFVLKPKLVIMEGTGNWEMDAGKSIGWIRLLECCQFDVSAVITCLPRHNEGFESWILKNEGKILRYKQNVKDAPEPGEKIWMR